MMNTENITSTAIKVNTVAFQSIWFPCICEPIASTDAVICQKSDIEMLATVMKTTVKISDSVTSAMANNNKKAINSSNKPMAKKGSMPSFSVSFDNTKAKMLVARVNQNTRKRPRLSTSLPVCSPNTRLVNSSQRQDFDFCVR